MFTSDEAATRAAGASKDSARQGRRMPVGIIEERRRTPPPTSILDPLTIAKAVWNAKLLILATTVLGIVCAVAYALATPKMYAATTQILVDPRDIKVVANEVTPNGLPSEATLALIESQTSVIMSNNILSRVIADAGLAGDPEFNGESRTGLVSLLPSWLGALFAGDGAQTGEQQFRILARVRRALTVGRELKSFVINLSVDSRDPEKAARIANLTAAIFIDEQGRVQSDTARRATTALSSRLSELRQSVVEAEGAVEDYKSENALVGVGGRLVDDQYITRINDELARVRGDIPALRVKADSMSGASVEDVVRGTLPEELSSEALVRLRQSYSDLEQQAAVLAASLGPRHPQRIASEGALTAARQAISSELARIVSSAQTELARAEGTERDLTRQIAELKDKQIETSGSFVKLRELEREVDASRAVYEAFLLRARETSEQESLNTANVRVISEATPPLDPAGMSRKIVVAAGGILGFGLGLGIAIFFAVLKLTRAFFAGERRRDPDVRWAEADLSGGSRAVGPYVGPTAGFGESFPLPRSGGNGDLRPSVVDSGRASDAFYGASSIQATETGTARLDNDAQEGGRAVGSGDGEADEVANDPDAPEQRPFSEVANAPAFDEEKPQADSASTKAGGIALAEAGRRVPDAPLPDRLSLRDRIRALSEKTGDEGQGERASVVDPDVAVLRDEIQTVKQTIADIRRRREGLQTSL